MEGGGKLREKGHTEVKEGSWLAGQQKHERTRRELRYEEKLVTATTATTTTAAQ
jgi:hypothetical protein